MSLEENGMSSPKKVSIVLNATVFVPLFISFILSLQLSCCLPQNIQVISFEVGDSRTCLYTFEGVHGGVLLNIADIFTEIKNHREI
jgi:hypothetical protein